MAQSTPSDPLFARRNLAIRRRSIQRSGSAKFVAPLTESQSFFRPAVSPRITTCQIIGKKKRLTNRRSHVERGCMGVRPSSSEMQRKVGSCITATPQPGFLPKRCTKSRYKRWRTAKSPPLSTRRRVCLRGT